MNAAAPANKVCVPTAICLTPDRRYFGPALCVAAQIIDCGLPPAADLFLICEEADVWPHFDMIDEPLRGTIKVLVTSFDDVTRNLPTNNNGEHAITRRLFLDRALPDRYDRIIAVDPLQIADEHRIVETEPRTEGAERGGFLGNEQAQLYT